MPIDPEREHLEPSLEDDRKRLAPVLDAVGTYERLRPVRAALTAVAAVASVPVWVLARWPNLLGPRGSGLFLVAHGGALVGLAWSAFLVWRCRRAVRRLLNDARAPRHRTS
jgi:hypothetical protein